MLEHGRRIKKNEYMTSHLKDLVSFTNKSRNGP